VPAAVTAESPDLVPRVATFFTQYPEPLGIKDGAYFCTVLGIPIHDFPSATALHLNHNAAPCWLDPKVAGYLAVSVRFHRGKRAQTFLDANYIELMTVVSSVAGSSFPDFGESTGSGEGKKSPNSDDDTSSSYTIVEMTTQLVSFEDAGKPCAPTDAVMGPTLTRCINGLIKIVNGYRFAQRLIIPEPARERLGPYIVAATRAANPADGGWDAPARVVANTFAWPSQPFVRGAGSAFDSVALITRLEAVGHPVISLMHLQADLENALYHDGNFRATAVLAHSASEVLMDWALSGLLFEEGRSIGEAAGVFEKPLKTRVLAEFHPRLGGAWNVSGNKPVAVWARSLLKLRHRVAHAGYVPSYDEGVAASNAHFALGTHLRDRLATRAKAYPLTAGMIVSRGGFERRGKLTRAAEAAVAMAESQALNDFIKWRAELIRRRA
jgi:hypothetical protein